MTISRNISGGVLACVLLGPLFACAQTTCAPAHTPTINEVSAAMAHLFVAASEENETAWKNLTTTDFIAYEAGKRYDRDAFFQMLKDAHGKGIQFKWQVEEPRLEAAPGLATLIYVNRGAVITKEKEQPTAWLETTTFRYQNCQWTASFTDSVRAQH